MLSKPNAPVGAAINPSVADRGDSTQTIAPALIGMSLRQDIPGGLPSGRARFRFSCHDHSETEASGLQQKRSEQRSVPTSRVSKLDTSQELNGDEGFLRCARWNMHGTTGNSGAPDSPRVPGSCDRVRRSCAAPAGDVLSGVLSRISDSSVVGQRPPESRAVQPANAGRIVTIPQVGGLHHRYERRAA